MKKRAPDDEGWVGCIDPPGPLAPLSVQREFLMSLEDMPDCVLVRALRDEAIEYIRFVEERPGLREPSDLN